MLCITMKRGEYFTVGGDTVILFDQLSGERAHLTIHAPRSVSIVRGEVLERNGGRRPDCLSAPPPRKKPRPRPAAAVPWNDGRARAALALEKLAARLEANASYEEAQTLREQLSRLIPSASEEQLTG